MDAVKISIIAMFCASSIVTDYAMIGVPNVKVMDFIVFLGGFLYGAVAGSFIGLFSWAIYGTLNPRGLDPRILLATMFAETIYALTGTALRKVIGSTSLNVQRFKLSVLFATMGFLPTVLYDLVTNIAYAPVYNLPILFAILVGAPFAVLHECSNLMIFGVCAVPAITAVRKVVKK